MSDKEELCKAGLGFCDEIEKLMLEGKTDQALVPVARVIDRLEALDKTDPDPGCEQTYTKFGEMLFDSLFCGNLYSAGLQLHVIRMVFAEELQDDALLQDLLKSPPQKLPA